MKNEQAMHLQWYWSAHDFHLDVLASATPEESSHLRELASYSTKNSSGGWMDLSILFTFFDGNLNISWTFTVTMMA